MNAPNDVVIVGGGLAGAKGAEALRAQGFGGTLTLIADEQQLPYERPPLSKGYLAGSAPFEDAIVLPADWYREHDVDLRLGTRARSLDLGGHQVLLDNGDSVGFDKLMLATGSTPRHLAVPGADATQVRYLRTRDDADAIRSRFGPDRRLVIVGAGWIGLEVAAAARAAGTAVTVVEIASLPLVTVLGPELARVFAELHAAHGVDLRLGAGVDEIVTEDGQVSGIQLGTETIAADTIVAGIGVTPNVELARSAGLAVDDGVLVDAALRTSHPDVYAVGDIANHDHPVLGAHVRVEHWATALKQPAVAAAAMLGNEASYTDLPYFFSDQYDLGMEYVGHAPSGSYERVVVRGDLAAREFVAFWLDGEDRIRAAMNVNVWDVVDQVKPLITSGKRVDADRLTEPDVPYSAL